jgi:hypothetical protein
VKTTDDENLEATVDAATKTYGDEKLVGANTSETVGIDETATMCDDGTARTALVGMLAGTADHELTTT